MSTKTVSWALEQWLPPTMKIALVAIADCVNHIAQDTGGFPSLEYIADTACQSKSSIRRHIAGLVEMGLLTKEYCYADDGRQTSNFYRLNLDVIVRKGGDAQGEDEGEGVNLTPQGGCHSYDTQEGSTAVTPTRVPTVTPLLKGRGTGRRNQVERDARANADEEQPTIAGEADEAFSAFFEAWPDSAGESRPKAWAAWQGLREGERKQAFEKIGDFIEFWLKKKGRKHLIAPDTYLRERRFMNVPKAAASAAPVGVEIKPYSKECSALLFRYFGKDDPQERTRLLTAIKANRSHWVRQVAAPTIAETDALVFQPIDCERVRLWRQAFNKRGLVLPMPTMLAGLFVPGFDPPELAEKRGFSPDTAALLKGITGKDYSVGDGQ
ncbi:helix-turn-helix domain-containing protein [Pleomorphomonas oryzae]|uniref:helix-turn-helix domain-containing protein n=1 Tax=Pleomorphomonas oryzae TaxID=261934 RepID=UPI00047A5584|nr:helix-turn-helix domain-containing protein [Pleomorphomonas oryzae]